MSTTAPRRRAPVRSAGPHFAAFLERYCRHTKGPQRGQPFVLEPFQRRFWNEAFRLDKSGRRVYSFVLSGRPRKNGKTAECAGLGLYLTGPDGEPGPDVAIGSGSKDQAGLVFTQAAEFVKASRELSQVFKPLSSVITAPASGGVLKRVSSEGRLSLGLNLSGAVLDELQVFETDNDRTLYAALVTASGVREEPFIASITNAGWNKATLLGELYDAALKLDDVEVFGKFGELTVAKDPEAGFLFWWYAAPVGADIEDRKMWRAVNPLSAVRMQHLETMWRSPALTTSDFERFHLNRWTFAFDQWISDAVWRKSAVEDEVTVGRGPLYLAVDASLTYDTTALGIAQPREEGRVLHDTVVWSVRADVPHHRFVPGGRIDQALVTQQVHDLARAGYEIRELVYDPRYFEDQAQLLARAGFKVAPMAAGTVEMVEATARFYLDANAGKTLHRSGEPGRVLTEHVMAAAAVKTERGWKVSKLKQSRPIDALISMVMAHARALRRSESVYERRGLLVLGEDAREAGRRRLRARAEGDEE